MGLEASFKKMWEKGRKVDPLTHKALEAIVGQDSENVKKIARGLSKATGGEGSWLGRRFNDLGDEAAKNEADPVRGIGRAGATAGLVFGGMYAAGAMGGGGASGAAAGSGLTAGATGSGAGLSTAGTTAAAGTGGLAGTGLGAAGGAGTGTTLGAAGGGFSAAGTTAGGTATGLGSTGLGSSGAASGFSPQFQKLMQMRTPQQQPQPYQWENVEVPENPYLDDLSLSSKQAKTPAKNVDQAIERGARGDNPIDQNGVQMAAIKELTRRVGVLRTRIEQRRGAR